ncbi:extracellular solute-binding protein [Arthrobacter subterraneus]|uniref:Extracellular solute-binding protein n=1 Tax=Arthrobacter subterraneus TaxID=335973 RepID=A0A1G8LEA2_9MICC|nr:ABC transporter substrate-binding protein [Arthrobacter subterraneus]SDI53985.1 extracellular solute-binding protein [Arthrobacter subterraneus]
MTTKNSSRRNILPSIVLISSLLVTSCAAGSGSQAGSENAGATSAGIDETTLPEGVEIDFWHIQATIYGEAITEMVEEFNATNEWGIVVNESFKGSYQELNQAVRASLAGGGSPDVTMAYENDTLEYLANDVIVPLDPYLESEKYGVTEEEIDDMVDGVLARQRVDAYNGSTLSWPHGNSSMGMYYNADLFKKAGIEAPPADWDEFMEQARQMKEETGLPYVALGTGKNGIYYNIMRSKGTTPYDPEAGTTEFASPVSIEALELLAGLYEEELAYTAADTEQEFTNERTASEIGTTARTSTKIEQIGDRFDWTVALTPQESEEPVTQLFGGNHVILASDDSEQELAAWLFMRWFAGTDAQAIYAARTGYSPAVESALETELLTTNYEENPQKAAAFENVFVNAQIMPPTAAGNAIDDMVTGVVEEVVLGRLTPQEAADRMDAEATTLLASAPQN